MDCWIGSIVGTRDNQEDWSGLEYSSEAGAITMVLADGMGGHVSGEIASRTSGETFIDAFKAQSEASIGERLVEALSRANARLSEMIAEDPTLEGMGTTFLAVHIQDGLAHWLSVGDSLLWLFRAGELRRLNSDHSYGTFLDKEAEKGNISVHEARTNPERHALMSAVMGDTIEMVEVSDVGLGLETGDVLLLASDGLETLGPALLASLLSSHAGTSAERIGRVLLDEVQDAGLSNQDNTTVLVVRV